MLSAWLRPASACWLAAEDGGNEGMDPCRVGVELTEGVVLLVGQDMRSPGYVLVEE